MENEMIIVQFTLCKSMLNVKTVTLFG